MLEIIKYPAEILDKQMPKFDFDNPIMDPKELKETLLEAQFAGNGVGLSACQIGIETAAFTMGSEQYKDKAQIFINPTVLDARACLGTLFDCDDGTILYVATGHQSIWRGGS